MHNLAVHTGEAGVDGCHDQASVCHGVALEHSFHGGGIFEGGHVNAQTMVGGAAIGDDFIHQLTMGAS